MLFLLQQEESGVALETHTSCGLVRLQSFVFTRVDLFKVLNHFRKNPVFREKSMCHNLIIVLLPESDYPVYM